MRQNQWCLEQKPFQNYILGGGFKDFLFSPRILGEMIQFD